MKVGRKFDKHLYGVLPNIHRSRFGSRIFGCAGRDTMDDKLSSWQGRDRYVRNVLRNKMLTSRDDFAELMKNKFPGDIKLASASLFRFILLGFRSYGADSADDLAVHTA